MSFLCNFGDTGKLLLLTQEQLFQAEEFVSSISTKNENIALLFTKSCKWVLMKNINENWTSVTCSVTWRYLTAISLTTSRVHVLDMNENCKVFY